MAWRPYENLIDGELENTMPGKVTGWMRFYRRNQPPLRVLFNLKGDFHEDIRGLLIRFTNPQPSDRNDALDREGTYMEGFSAVQRGEVGDITAGLSLGPWNEERAQSLMAQHEHLWDDLGIRGDEREKRRRVLTDRYRMHIEAEDAFFPYVDYPYIEWYSETNGRVVLELEARQVEIFDQGALPCREKIPWEAYADDRRRQKAMTSFLAGMSKAILRKSRDQHRDGNVSGPANQ